MSDNEHANGSVSFSAVFEQELHEISERRESLGCYPAPSSGATNAQNGCNAGAGWTHADHPPLSGLSLSGGGIRSGCFSLGLIEALDAEPFSYEPNQSSQPKVRCLELFDYLSAVSGGSYAAGHLAMTNLKPQKEVRDQTIFCSHWSLETLWTAAKDASLLVMTSLMSRRPDRDRSDSVTTKAIARGIWRLETLLSWARNVGLLTMASFKPEPRQTQEQKSQPNRGQPRNTPRQPITLGDLQFDNHSIPHWSWVIGVWFIGFLFQLAKTGAILTAILGSIAFFFRMCDAPEVGRFCDAVGLNTDVKRGFAPFLVVLGVTFALFKHRNSPRHSYWLLSLYAIMLAFYSTVALHHHHLRINLPFSFHLYPIVFLFAASISLLYTNRIHPATTRWALCLAAGTYFTIHKDMIYNVFHSQPDSFLNILFKFALGVLIVSSVFVVFRAARAAVEHDPLNPSSVRRLSNEDAPQHKRSDEGLNNTVFLLPLLTGLFCIAGLITTGDLDIKSQTYIFGFPTSQEFANFLSLWGQRIFAAATVALGLTSLAFVRWWDLARSTAWTTERTSRSPWQPVFEVVVYLCSYGLLLLLIFVLYGMLVRENISEYNRHRRTRPDAAFLRSDLSDWDKAWEKIRHDAKPENRSPWHKLADSLLKALDQPDSPSALSSNHHAHIQQQINRLDAEPLLSPHPFSNLSTLYDLYLKSYRTQEDFARRISDTVLTNRHLFCKIDPHVLLLPTERQRLLDKYFQSASVLADLAATDGVFEAAVRWNNRQALRLYLEDLMVNDDAQPPKIYSSVVWFEDQCTRVRVVFSALVIWAICIVADDKANRFSLLWFYKEQIFKQWICPPTNDFRQEVSPSTRNSATYQFLGVGTKRYLSRCTQTSTAARRVPFLMINATVSEGSRSLGDDPDIDNDIFTFTCLWSGSRRTGYWLGDLNRKFVANNKIDLSQMVAVSGAFLSPRQVANPTLAAIFHILNIQTGLWVIKPESKESFLQRNIGFHFWQSLGIDWDKDDHVLLTDGAHVENLGLKVLLDRECSLIVASDCSQASDGGHPFCVLIEVLRHARLKGIKIGPFLCADAFQHWLDKKALVKAKPKRSKADCRRPLWRGLNLLQTTTASPGAQKKPKANGDSDETKVSDQLQLAQEHFLFAHIEYPEGLVSNEPCQGGSTVETSDGGAAPANRKPLTRRREGLLVYLRPTLTGDEGESLLRPGFAGALFPNDSPLDQFYNVARMNSYRLLGRHIGRQLVQCQVFQNALKQVIHGNDVFDGSRVVAKQPPNADDPTHACLACLKKKRSDPCQADLDADFRDKCTSAC